MLDKVLVDMKKSPGKPRPLGGGLTLRLNAHAGGVYELIAWREKKAPSGVEMSTLIDTIKAVDDPVLVFRTQAVELSADGRFHAYRLWWVVGDVAISWLRPVQQSFPVPFESPPTAVGEGAFS